MASMPTMATLSLHVMAAAFQHSLSTRGDTSFKRSFQSKNLPTILPSDGTSTWPLRHSLSGGRDLYAALFRPLLQSSSFTTSSTWHKKLLFFQKSFQKELSVHRVLLCLIFANRNQNLPKFVSHQVTLQFFKWKVMDWTFDRCWKIFKVFSKIFVTIDSRLCWVFSRQNSFSKNF